MKPVERVLATEATRELIEQIQKDHGELMFHQSGGCCDGSQPMCFTKDEFKVGSSDVCIGIIGNSEFWMSADQYEYWKHTQLTIDVVDGRGSSFSLEIPYGKRFVVKSRLFTEAEREHLKPLRYTE